MIRVLCLTLCALPMFGGWTFKASAHNGGPNSYSVPASGSVNMTGADTLFVTTETYYANPAGCTISDSTLSNSYALVVSTFDSVAGTSTGLWYVYNATVSSTMTWTVNCGSLSYTGTVVAGYSGGKLTAASLDLSTGTDYVSAVTVMTPGAITAPAGELVVTTAGVNNNTASSVSSPFSPIVDTMPVNNGSNQSVSLAVSVSVGTATNPTWTIPSSGGSALIASFKQAPVPQKIHLLEFNR